MPRAHSLARVVAAATLALGLTVAAPASAEQWQPPANVSNAITKSPTSGLLGPSIAVAADGTTYIAYEQTVAGADSVWVSVRRRGAPFSKAIRLSADGEDAYAPAVAVDAQGDATVAFGADGFVKARTGKSGTWGSEVQVSADAQASPPTIAVGDHGAAVVAYYDHATKKATAAIRSAGQAGFGSPAQISGGLTNVDSAAAPHAAMDAAGDAVIAWDLYTGTHEIQAAAAPAGHAFSSPKTLSTAAPITGQFAVAMTPDGRASVAWDQVLGGGSVVRVADATITPSFTSTDWSSATVISDLLQYSVAPFLAYDAAGELIATWSAGDSSPADHVAGAIRPSGGAFPTSRTISTSPVADDIVPLAGGGPVGTIAPVVTTPKGDTAVTWSAPSGGGVVIDVVRRRAGQAQFGGVTTAAPTSGAAVQSFPAVGIDSGADIFTSWLHTDGTKQDIQATALDTAPPGFGTITVPATVTAGRATAMRAAASDAVSAASVHWSFGDGRSAEGPSVSHTYRSEGTVTVTITATDSAGHRSAVRRTVRVRPFPTLSGRAKLAWNKLKNGSTRLRKLTIVHAGTGTAVKLTCMGKGCKKKAAHTAKTTRKTKGTLSLTKYVKGMALKPKAKLRVEITHAEKTGRVYVYTMVKKKAPKKSIRCLDPGARKTRAC